MIKVLIIDDSAVVRRILKKTLDEYEDICVIGTAQDPFVARDMIVKEKPDVITLDIEMPRMDGLTFLSKLMIYMPIPTIIISSLTRTSREMTVKALEIGAVDVISKPASSFSVNALEDDLVEKIRIASRAVIRKKSENKLTNITQVKIETTKKIIAIGSSTGGTEALTKLLTPLPANMPGMVISQHMPPNFTKSLSERLNSICKIRVKEAENGDVISFGTALIAPGNFHLLVKRSGANYYVEIKDGPRVHFQRPSVDVMFKSVAMEVGKNAIGVILTGMGADGAEGLKMMKDRGAITIGQDESSSVVYGMPKAAYDCGAVCKQLPLQSIPYKLVEIASRQEYHF